MRNKNTCIIYFLIALVPLVVIFIIAYSLLFSTGRECDGILLIENYNNREKLYYDCKIIYENSQIKSDEVIKLPQDVWPLSFIDIGSSNVYILKEGVSITFLGGHSLPLEVFFDPDDECLYLRKNFTRDVYFKDQY